MLRDVILLQISQLFSAVTELCNISWILISELLSNLFDRDFGQVVLKYGLKDAHLSILMHKPLRKS